MRALHVPRNLAVKFAEKMSDLRQIIPFIDNLKNELCWLFDGMFSYRLAFSYYLI